MIKLENVYKSFADKIVLDNISATFEQGKTNLIIGQSGSGKTVLLKCIVGLHEIDKGQIKYDDKVFSGISFNKRTAFRKETGMVFQAGALFDSSTVEANVTFPLDMFTDMSTEEKCERANFCLKRVNLENANKLYPSEISGGMKKRVAIARAISLNPKYLFCDEPNSGLDPKTSNIIDNLINEITAEYNITTVVNSHDMNSVLEIGDKVIFIYEGIKSWEGTKENVLDSDNEQLRSFIFATKLMRKLKVSN